MRENMNWFYSNAKFEQGGECGVDSDQRLSNRELRRY